MLVRALGCLLLTLALGMPCSVAWADAVPAGAEWSEATFPSGDGTVLHADILRPAGLPAGVKTPVLLVVSPYTGHSGSAFSPSVRHSGPTLPYPDVFERVRLFERGWSLVTVDLRGYGGSAGCPDWGGPGEQSDVKAAVEWAAGQPWSTGRVALYGLSYEGKTAIMGLGGRPRGLAAAFVANAVGDAYRWSYSHGVRIHHSVVSPPAYLSLEVLPGTVDDEPDYIARAVVTNPACSAANMAGNQLDDPDAPFWAARRNTERARGTGIPLFFSQGLLDDNVRPDESLVEMWRSATGPKRAWIGQFHHHLPSHAVAVGMAEFDQAVFRFLDHHVRGVSLADAPTDRDPEVVLGVNDGTWRAEPAWPPEDVRMLRTPLRGGQYIDSGDTVGSVQYPLLGTSEAPARATERAAGKGLWTISQPLPHPVHLSGLPRLTVEASSAVPNPNLVVDLYEINPQNKATLITREAMLLRSNGRSELTLHAQDWRVPAGHRLGVLITSSNVEFWIHRATGAQVSVTSASIDLPFRTVLPGPVIATKPPVRLTQYLRDAPFTVTAQTVAAAESAFALPGPLREAPAAAPVAPVGSKPSKTAAKRRPRLTARAGAARRKVTVIGNAPSGARVRVALVRGRRTVARRTVVAKLAAYRATLRAPRAGRYRVVVTATRRGARFTARPVSLRIR